MCLVSIVTTNGEPEYDLKIKNSHLEEKESRGDYCVLHKHAALNELLTR